MCISYNPEITFVDGSQCGPWSATSVSLGNWLKFKFPGPTPDLQNQKFWRGPAICFNKHSRWIWCMLRFENHYIRKTLAHLYEGMCIRIYCNIFWNIKTLEITQLISREEMDKSWCIHIYYTTVKITYIYMDNSQKDIEWEEQFVK